MMQTSASTLDASAMVRASTSIGRDYGETSRALPAGDQSRRAASSPAVPVSSDLARVTVPAGCERSPADNESWWFRSNCRYGYYYYAAEQRPSDLQEMIATRTSSGVAAKNKPSVARGNKRLRALDRAVGVPVLAAAGTFRRKRHVPGELGRIGILKSVGIGDMILLSGVIRDIAAAFPTANVFVTTLRSRTFWKAWRLSRSRSRAQSR
jgi:hypothetical protein